MVFKVVSGVGSDIYQLWSAPNALFEKNREALNVNSSFRNHYKNRLVQKWQTVVPREVGGWALCYLGGRGRGVRKST